METATIGNRIIILGCSGSGKSTFSQRLHERTDLPLFHLDNVWWKADQTHITREEFDQKLAALMQGAKWIIDGDYSRTYEVRFCACDTVIFLDYSMDICMDGIIGRVGKQREDIPWIANSLDPELVASVQSYQSENKPVIYGLMKKYPEKHQFIFQTRFQGDKWLSEL